MTGAEMSWFEKTRLSKQVTSFSSLPSLAVQPFFVMQVKLLLLFIRSIKFSPKITCHKRSESTRTIIRIYISY